MKKEKLLLLISDLKNHFKDYEIAKFLVDLISCKNCPFRKDCYDSLGDNRDLMGTCEDYFRCIVKGVKIC